VEDRQTTQAGERPPVTVQLLDTFGVHRYGCRVDLPARAGRLVACLAVRAGPVGRSTLAGHLWPAVTERQAATSLRSTLLAVRRACPELLDTGPHHVGLAPTTTTDLVELEEWCRRAVAVEGDGPGFLPFTHCPVLLPDVDDEWVAIERHHLRQRVLHALEVVADQCRAAGRFAEAAMAASCAVVSDPLRESARRALIRVHLAEGNLAAAVLEYQEFRALLDEELGVAPSAQITALVAATVPGRPRP
jgi:DNA-binding SARP family transcriptional activator